VEEKNSPTLWIGVGPYFMVRPERVELSTFSLGMKCSIHLSYGRTRGIIADFGASYVVFGVASFDGLWLRSSDAISFRASNIHQRVAVASRISNVNERSDVKNTYVHASMLICGVAIALFPASASPRQDPPSKAATSAAQRDGSHDFDPLLGSWKYHLRRRLNPLTGSDKWVDYEGTGVCRTIYDGAQIDQLAASGSAGAIEGLTLRTYNPASHQWRLYWANKKVGILDPPQVGEFKDGVGEFFAVDTINNKTILIRFRWTNMNTTPHFEQSFSDDGGKTWEVNWITDQTRVADPDKSH
jgi:hypothetical protein